MLVEALLIVFALLNNAMPALVVTLVALAATIATIFVTPPWWRKYLPAGQAKREHLAGLRRYLALAEADRLRVLQSPSGAELRADVPGAADSRRAGLARVGESGGPDRHGRIPPTRHRRPSPSRGSTCTNACCPMRCSSDSSANGSRS